MHSASHNKLTTSPSFHVKITYGKHQTIFRQTSRKRSMDINETFGKTKENSANIKEPFRKHQRTIRETPQNLFNVLTT